jgi:hypothetical protein
MIQRFIIVERDTMLRDCGVFTGQVQIVESRHRYLDDEREVPMQAMDGLSSPDIEHAFLFNAAWTAWRYAMQFEPHWDTTAGRYLGHRRWEVRKDLDYFSGEVRHGLAVKNTNEYAKAWIPQEAIIAATASGFEQGRRSVIAEKVS